MQSVKIIINMVMVLNNDNFVKPLINCIFKIQSKSKGFLT